jgi:hypothetical protein
LAAKNPQLRNETWHWISELQFSGSVMYEDFPPGQRDDTIVLLNDRMSIIPLVAGPVNFLVRYAATFVPLWGATRQTGVFFEPSAFGELSAYIESTVANALGNDALVRSAEPRKSATVMYGDGSLGFSMISEPPFVKAQEIRRASDDIYRKLDVDHLLQTGSLTIAFDKYDFEKAILPSRSVLTEEDGFVTIDNVEAIQPWRNIARWRNECSPYSILRSQIKGPSLTVDTYYGRVFDFPLEENFGIYGITKAIPNTPGTQGEKYYLRTPYRKIPAYVVRSRTELDSVLKRVKVFGDASNRLFRGQSREYAINRSTNANEILYGDANAIEPSLLASSVRSKRPLEAVLPEWCLLVRAFLDWVWSNQLKMPELAETYPIIEEDRARILNGIDLHLYAISMAQHYGLPSMGLDVTEDLNTAIFFAMHQTERSTQSRTIRYKRKTSGDPPGVLYVFAPDERYRLIHDISRPRSIGGGRQEPQGAKFLVTGWGFHRNAIARHLGLALYLDPAGDFGSLPTARNLFPPREEDLFGGFLERTLEQDELPKELRKYVEQLYWVVDD